MVCDEGRAAWRGTYMSVLVARPRAVSEVMDQQYEYVGCTSLVRHVSFPGDDEGVL